MHGVDGDLLIGGERLAHLSCELDEEQCAQRAREWRLSGRLSLTPEETARLELERIYRLQLADGRAGQIVVTHFAADNPQRVLAEFHPPRLRRRPK